MPGDKVMLYTDAIEEVRNKENEMINSTEFSAMLTANCTMPIANLFDTIYQFGLDFNGTQRYDDDFTLVGFEVFS